MKVSKEQASANRAALVKAAGRLFRAKGIDGVGVAEISQEAGLTHGALYAQFPSKSALAAEALSDGLAQSYAALLRASGGKDLSLDGILDFLLSPRQRENLALGCPLTASASEIARLDDDVSARYAQGFEQLVAVVHAALGDTPDARARALAIIAAEIGVIAVARATHKANPRLSDEVLSSARRVLGTLGDPPVPPKKGKRAV